MEFKSEAKDRNQTPLKRNEPFLIQGENQMTEPQ